MRLYLAFSALLFFAACHPEPAQRSLALYHWKNQFQLDTAEIRYLDQLGCRALYLKFLDIARDETGAIRPYSLLELVDSTGLAGRRLIPCVFITNHVFQQISEPELEALVQNTARALSNVGAQFPTADFKEYQFDCDWTAGTRAAFFRFLKKIRPLLPPGCRISATIRLHQYKFPDRTGLPPVDRGMLMLYNTGDIDDPLGGNSIFQAADAEKYLNGAPANFPLPLDLALPIFSWALVYRDGALWKIIPEPDLTELQDTSRFQLQTPNSKLQTPNSKLQTPNSKLQTPNSKLQTPNFKLQTPNFKLLQSTYLGGHYLRPGDWLRLETVDTALLRQAARLAARADLAPDARLAFFHLDTAAMRRYPPIFLKSVCETIEK